MKQLTWYTSKIKSMQALVLNNFKGLRDLKQQKSYFFALSNQQFITELSKKRNGEQYIPLAYLKLNEFYVMSLDRNYFLLKPIDIQESHVVFMIREASKADMFDKQIIVRFRGYCQCCKTFLPVKSQAFYTHSKKLFCLKCFGE